MDDLGDTLQVDFAINNPEVYGVTNLQVDKINFVNNAIPDSTFNRRSSKRCR